MIFSQQAGEGVEIILQLRRWHGDIALGRTGSQHHLPHRAAVAFGDETGRGAAHSCAAVLANGLAQIKPQHRVASGLNGHRLVQPVDAVENFPLIGIFRVDAQLRQRV